MIGSLISVVPTKSKRAPDEEDVVREGMLFEQRRPYIYPLQFENGYRGHKERHMRIQLRNATVKALNSVIRTRNLEARACLFSGALDTTYLCVGNARGL